jgi:uncharacterized membrane protein
MGEPNAMMPTSNRMSLLTTVLMVVLFPLLLWPLFVASLQKLHLSPDMALNLTLAIIIGGLINIPVKRIVRETPVWSHPLTVYALDQTIPRWLINRRETVIAVNVGGCIIPVGIAVYQLAHLAPLGMEALSAAALATAIVTFISYMAATPVAGVGIVMPGFVAPIAAALSAIFLAPEYAPPVAFVAGVIGTLVGADFFHIGDFIKTPVGVASIGGAGTFDGIVLAGIIAAFLAVP